MNSGKIILGALAGLAAGALIGVLFAPDKGSDSRQKIVKRGEDYLDSTKEKFNALLDDVSGKFNDSRSKIVKKSEEYLDSTKEKFNTLLDSISGKFNGGRVEVSGHGETRKNNLKEARREM